MMELALDVLACAIALLVYGVCCLVCIKRAKGKTSCYAKAPTYLGLLLAVILSSLGLYSGTVTVIEILVLLGLLIINAGLIRKIGFEKNT